MTTFHTAYGPKLRVQLEPGPGLTKQALAAECNINLIMAKFIKTGIVEHAKTYAGQYNFATSDDYHTCLNVVIEADSMFQELPAKARQKFGNNPADFLEFVQNPDNEDQLFDLGLTNWPIEPEPTPEPPAPAPTPPTVS